MILLPKYKDIELASAVGLRGEYRLVVSEADGTVAKDTGWFDNLITDNGLNLLAISMPLSKMSVGTGTTPPLVSDLTLETFVQASDTSGSGGGYVPTFGVQNTVSPYELGVVNAYRFSIGQLNTTVSEVGISNTTNGTSLFSRALIVDALGLPTTITVTSTQQLDAFYRISKRPPLVDTSNTVTIGGVTYTVTGRAAYAGDHSSWDPIQSFNGSFYAIVGAGGSLGPITGGPVGQTASLFHQSGITVAPYVANSHHLQYSTAFDTSQGNVVGGIKTIVAAMGVSSRTAATVQYELSAPIPKTTNQTMVLNFQVGWARA